MTISVASYTGALIHELNNKHSKVSTNVLQQLRINKIVKLEYKRTKRGCRGGQRRRIRCVQLSNHRERTACKQKTVNLKANDREHNRLIRIEPVHEIHQTCLDTPPLNNFRICCINTRSCRNKTETVKDCCEEEEIDILCITETWQKEIGDEPIMNQMKPLGYELKTFPRKYRTGGGIAFLYKSTITVTVGTCQQEHTSFEAAGLNINLGSKTCLLVCIYRPERIQKKKIPVATFINDFTAFAADLRQRNEMVIMTGDFNFHMDVLSNPEAEKLRTCLGDLDLIQYVDKPTHIGGHTLDLVT